MDDTECADTLDGAPSSKRTPGPDQPTLATPDRIGRYVILRRLGAGGMGVVFAAYDDQLDRKLAIKLLHRRDEPSRLQREAQGLARLSHPNVVQIYEIGEHEGAVFLAMEFVAGETLGDWLERAPRSRAQIFAAFTAAGRGLAAAHAARLIHRDFKPDNVMIGPEGEVKVMDFGLVRAEGEAAPATDTATANGDAEDPLELERSLSASHLSQELTRTGSVMGTPAYMAPEQHLGEPADARSDQFSFCVALWEALYGARPFRGDSIASLTFNVLRGEIAEPPRDAGVPTWIRRVLERGLALEADARWPSMDALLAALARDPRPRRVALVGAVAAAILGLGGWGLATVQRQRAETAKAQAREAAIASCEARGPAFVEPAWNDARAQRGARAFAASKLAFADDAWTRSAARLGEYAAELAAARTRACVESEVDATLEPDLAALTERCLDDRLARLDSLTALLAEADDARIHSALSSSASLPLVADCSDARSLARQPPLPDDPEARAQVLALHGEIARLYARQTMGESEAAIEPARALVERAQALGWPPMIAATISLHADLCDSAGDYEAAREGFEQAMYIAGKAGDDALAAEAAIELAHTVGFDLGELEDGLRVARLAEVLLARTGAEGSLLEAALAVNVGAIRQRLGDDAGARAAFEAALAIQEDLLPPRHPTLAVTLNNLGAVYSKTDLERGLEFFQRSLAIREASYPPLHPRLATAYYNIGMTAAHLEKFAEARASLELALEINRLNLPADHPEIALVLKGLASVEFTADNFEAAARRYAEALAIREARLPPEHPDVARTHEDLGLALANADHFTDARTHLERAIEIYAADPNARTRLVQATTELARVLRELGELDASFARFEDALRIAQEPEVAPVEIGLVRWFYAFSLWEHAPRRRAEAVEMMKACYVDYAKHGQPGDNDAVVEWLRERGAEPPELPAGHPTNVTP